MRELKVGKKGIVMVNSGIRNRRTLKRQKENNIDKFKRYRLEQSFQSGI